MRKNLHPDDRELWFVVRGMVRRYSVIFGLELKKVVPMKRHHTKNSRGLCSDTGKIQICLRTYQKGKWDKKRDIRYEIFQTLAHELAHLKHFDHGPEWFKLYVAILALMTAEGQFEKFCKAYGKAD